MFHVCFWFARTYARGRPTGAAAWLFNPSRAAKTSPLPKQTVEQLQHLAAELQGEGPKSMSPFFWPNQVRARRGAEAACGWSKSPKPSWRAQAIEPDTLDYSEAETRDRYIDQLLKEAGWAARPRPRDREFEVAGMPNSEEHRKNR